MDVKLTGILSTGALAPDDMMPDGLPGRPFGTTMSPGGLNAPSHQHFFVARLDMAVDGLSNTVTEVDTVTDPTPMGPAHTGHTNQGGQGGGPKSYGNRFGNGFFTQELALSDEWVAQRDSLPIANRHWVIASGAPPAPATSAAAAGAAAGKGAGPPEKMNGVHKWQGGRLNWTGAFYLRLLRLRARNLPPPSSSTNT